jgi:hypothetical protein
MIDILRAVFPLITLFDYVRSRVERIEREYGENKLCIRFLEFNDNELMKICLESSDSYLIHRVSQLINYALEEAKREREREKSK